MIDWLSRLIRGTNSDSDSDETGSRSSVGVLPLVFLAALGAALILLGSGLLHTGDRSQPQSDQAGRSLLPADNVASADDYAAVLERNLESALSRMRGVGGVSVIVTLDADARKVSPMIKSDDNEQVEEKTGGGTRTTAGEADRRTGHTRIAGGGEEIVLWDQSLQRSGCRRCRRRAEPR